MRTKIGCAALLAGMMGIATGAAAGENNASLEGKRGLSFIVPYYSFALESIPD